MEVFVAQLLNGLVYGVLLFLIAAGLSLIFGLMNVVSLAHGSFFMLGAYLRAVDLQDHRQLLAGARPGADSRDRARRPDGAPVLAAALSPRPSRSGAADVRLHLRVPGSRADTMGPHGAAPAGTAGIAGHGADRTWGVFRLSAVSDRLRVRDRVAAVAVSGTQPDRRHGARRRRQRGHGRRSRRQHPGAVYRNLRFRRGARGARRYRGRAGARPLSRNG